MTPAKVLGRDIAHYLQCNFMALTDEQFTAAFHAWLSCQVADGRDHDNDLCRRLHKLTLVKMLDALAA